MARCKKCGNTIIKWQEIVGGIYKYDTKSCRQEHQRELARKQKEKDLKKREVEKKREKKEKAKEKRAKIKEVKWLYKKNVELAKLIAKIRDNRTCQWCWKYLKEDKMNCHWSHIINEARDHRLSTDEFNIKALCHHCHMNLWHKDPVLASKWFNEKFPWRYDILNKKHIEYWKMWKIWNEWHIAEHWRLKDVLKTLEK